MSAPTAPEFNSSEPWGGNPLTTDVNAQYAGLEFHYVYLAFCCFIVWLIIPGIGLLYGGLARRKSSLSLLFQSILVAAVTTFQWMFWVRVDLFNVVTNQTRADVFRATRWHTQGPQTHSSVISPTLA